MRGLLLKDDKEKEKDGVPTGILLQDGKDGKTGKKIIQNVCVNCGQVMGSEDSLYQDNSLFTGVQYCRAARPNYLQQQHAAVQLK